MRRDAIVTMPPLVVRTLASSTVLVKASSRVNRDFAGMVKGVTDNFLSLTGSQAQLTELQRYEIIVEIGEMSM